jgi:hypothetical protein
MRLEALGGLTAIAGGPAAAIDLAQNVLCRDRAIVDLDVFEELVGKAQLAGEHIHGVVIVLRFEHRFHDLFAPLKRAVGSRA